MKKFIKKCEEKLHIILVLITVFCFLGFLFSLLFPDTVLDTYSVNISEAESDEEFGLSLENGEHVGYLMSTKGLAMRGIQIGIDKQGQVLSGNLRYDVYVMKEEVAELLNDTSIQWESKKSEGTLVSENAYDVSQGFDVQYVYLPYDHFEQCKGLLYIDFYMEPSAELTACPKLLANHTVIDETATICGEKEPCGLKGYYIYTHHTYPFLYDFRILSFIMLAVTMTVQFPKMKGLRGGKNHENSK